MLQCSSHLCAFSRAPKNVGYFFIGLEMNLLRTVIHSFSLSTSLIFQDNFMSVITQIFSMLASIPLSNTMKPKDFPKSKPKVHLDKFSFIMYFSRWWMPLWGRRGGEVVLCYSLASCWCIISCSDPFAPWTSNLCLHFFNTNDITQ